MKRYEIEQGLFIWFIDDLQCNKYKQMRNIGDRERYRMLHREEGPALEWVNGEKHYYLYGKEIHSEDEFKQKVSINAWK